MFTINKQPYFYEYLAYNVIIIAKRLKYNCKWKLLTITKKHNIRSFKYKALTSNKNYRLYIYSEIKALLIETVV